MAAQQWETPGTRARRRPPVAAALLLVPALVALVYAGLLGDGGGDAGIPVETAAPEPDAALPGRPPTPPPEAGPDEPAGELTGEPPAPLTARGAWHELGEAPVAVPGTHHAVWTGAELVVFGSEGESAAYDPAGGTWRALPPAPVVPEALPPLWTGERVVVLGSPPGGSGRLQVATLDPTGGPWRTGASGRLPAVLTGTAAWTGREVLVWGAVGTVGKVAASYDPAADTWSPIPQAPVPQTERVAGVWSGRELVVWGNWYGRGGAQFAAAYDPLGGRWRKLPAPPVPDAPGAAAVVTGSRLVLAGESGFSADARGEPSTEQAEIDLDEAQPEWRVLDPLPSEHADRRPQRRPAGAWTGQQVVFVGSLSWEEGWVYEPGPRLWRVLPRGGGNRLGPAVAWTGEQLLVWGGYTPTGPSVDLVAWEPVDPSGFTATCRAGATPPGDDRAALPAGWRRSSPPPLHGGPAPSYGEWAVVAAGDRVVVLKEGRTPRPLTGAALHTGSGEWDCLPDAPLDVRAGAAVVWTGEEVVVWGGESGRPLADGAAYDPAARSWRRLPPAPVAGGAPSAAVWSGREVLVWGVQGSTRGPGPAGGAAYDPATNRWRELPAAPSSLARGGGAWTGSELVVVGMPGGGTTDRASAYALDPATGRWRVLDPPPLSPLASTVAVAGGALVAWDYLLSAAIYEPSTGTWAGLPAPPLRASECYPASAAVRDEAVLAWYCGQAAVLDLRDRSWRPVEVPSEAGATIVSTGDSLHSVTPSGAVLTFRPEG